MNNPWQGAADWLRNNYQDYANVASLCDAMLSAAPVSGQGAITRLTERYAEWKGDTSMTDQEKRTRCMLDEIANLRSALLDSRPRSEDSRAKVLEEAAQIAFCHDLGTPDGHTIGNAIRALASTPPKADNE